MNNEVKKFIEKKGWEFKDVINDQFNVKICPFCEDPRWKFYINSENGCWDCKICGESGSFYNLKARVGELNEISSVTNIFENKQEISLEVLEEFQNNLKKCPDALKYLTEKRGFTLETIKKFKLGLDRNFIVIPHIENGKFWNAKFRNYKEKGFKRITGQPSILFNVDNLNFSKPALVIVESETDCIAATQLGIENVIGLTTGAQSFPPEWIPYTKKFKDIYICLNSDLPGQKGAQKLAKKLGISRCKNVILPVKDVNDYLLEHDGNKIEFKKLLLSAEKIKIGDISSLSDYINNLDEWFDNDGSITGLSIPFPKTNSYLNGFKEEDFIILSGTSGSGKSTICLNILNEFLKNGKKCLCFFLEGKVMFYILRMMSIETGISMNKLRDDPVKWNDIKKQFASYPLYFYSGAQADMNIKKLVELSTVTIDSYGIEFVAIDNLQKIVVDNRDVVHNIGQAITSLKNLAVDKKIPVLLIAHVRKPQGNSPRVTMFEAKNSSEIYQQADIYLVIWNNKKDNFQEDNIFLTIEKNRMGEGNIDVQLVFEKEIGRFSERVDIKEIKPESPSKFKNIKKENDGFKPIIKIKEDDEL